MVELEIDVGKLKSEVRKTYASVSREPERDFIQLPRFEAFHEGFGYYSTLAHEATHWTGALDRLNRNLDGRFGSSTYAAEELIAELGAAFLCSTLRISNQPRVDHARYICAWLELLRRDKRAVFTAASKAQDAVDWMQSKQDEACELLAEVGE